DSLMAIELRNQLAKGLEAQLPATLIFDYSTLNLLADFLLSKVVEQEETLDVDAEAKGYVERHAQPSSADTLNQQVQKTDLDSLAQDELAALLAQRIKKQA
ncbi:MAG: hypothetical protein KDE47_15895, partial [Caldilineaceae bacterium]|nr:hypothetical protein [Caldilineaceae bacterium]MCB0109709.1 hypothetical protein [Caldilineaceae bacterium]